jgi:hypothetical protein
MLNKARITFEICQINGENLQNLRRVTSGTFRKKRREYLKGKYNEFEIIIRNI